MIKPVCRVRMERVAGSTAAVLRARPATTSLETVAVLLDSRETAVSKLVSQEHLDRTVTRRAGAQRRTSSATRCLDCVTAPQVSTVPDVTNCVETVVMVQTVKASASVNMEGGAFPPLEPVDVQQVSSEHAATSRVQPGVMESTVLGWRCAETEPRVTRSPVAVNASLVEEERTVDTAAFQAGLGRTVLNAVTAVMVECATL